MLIAPMRIAYVIVFLIGFGALVFDHLSSPSIGRPVSPEDFAGRAVPLHAEEMI